MSDSTLPAAQPSSRSSQTLRLTFAYNGRDVRLINSQRIAMITPPSVTPPPAAGQSGYWFEVRAANNTLLYHRALHDPVRADVEVYTDDPAQTITRVPNPNPAGEFTLLVPDLPQAQTFSFHGVPARAEKALAPSEILVRHSFDELRRFQSGAAREGAQPRSEQQAEEEQA